MVKDMMGYFVKIKRGLRVFFNIKINYQCGDFTIQLTPDHLLPGYQKQFKAYDRFLPHLSSYFGPNDWVIDIGANCGDTLAAMIAKNTTSSYLCIEADNIFFDYLKYNIGVINKKLKKITIIPIKALVGTGGVSGVLSGKGGTKSLSSLAKVNPTGVSEPELHAVSLAKILQDFPETELIRSSLGDGKVIRLIKSDVDGYDFDVINSAGLLLNSNDLILYFECYYREDFQIEGYRKLMAVLFERGFRHFWIFDNFGVFMLYADQTEIIGDLIHYIENQNKGKSPRTIWYYDILACKDKTKPIINSAISSYLRFVES